jgi:hypothetical protein
MFERAIQRDAVKAVIMEGESIAEYPEDTPYPSLLMLGFYNDTALHVVVSRDSETENCYVVTVYQPDPELWEAGFRTRRS